VLHFWFKWIIDVCSSEVFVTRCYQDLIDLHYRDDSEPEVIEDWSRAKPKGWLDDEPEMIQDDKAIKPTDWLAVLYILAY